MPAYLTSVPPPDASPAAAKSLSGMAARRMPEQSRSITVGLVNNMPDGALESTERQFVSLLDAASGDRHIKVLLLSMPDICRKNFAANRVKEFYSDVDCLWNTRLDAIIVTGREPVTSQLRDESYWRKFGVIVDWAKEHTYSAVWSCLAAHGAVLHCDNVERVRTEAKQFGIFECSRTDEHFLTTGLTTKFKLPHSRWNGIPVDALTSSGYRVLSRSAVGADIFVKQHQSLFIFFQGHPEYDADTLMLEYRRDVGRFLKGETKVYPSVPHGYFDEEMVASLEEFREEAVSSPRRDLLGTVNGILAKAKSKALWRTDAIKMYQNWLEYIAGQKESHLFAKTQWSNMVQMIPIGAADISVSGGYLQQGRSGQQRPRRIANAR